MFPSTVSRAVYALASSTICRPKISPPKVIYKVQSMPYKSLPLGAFWTIFGRNFPTGVLQLLYPYQPANPLVESIFKALNFLKFLKNLKFSRYIWATERREFPMIPFGGRPRCEVAQVEFNH